MRISLRRVRSAIGVLSASAAALVISPPLVAQNVDAAPTYEIGASLSDPTDQLGEVLDLVLLPGGGVAILDRLASAVRVHDSEGRLLRTLGRSGTGPGEFSEPVDLQLVKGDLVVLDRSGRTSRFGPDGSLAGTGRVDAPEVDAGFNPVPAALLGDGRVLFRANQSLFGRVEGEYRQQAQLVVGTTRLGTFAADTGRVDTSGQPVPRPYIPGDRLLVASDSSVVVVVDPYAVVHVFGLDGQIQTRFDTGLDRPASVPSDAIAQREQALASLAQPNDRRVVAEWVDGMPRADLAPPVRRLVLGADRAIWIETWRPRETSAGPRSLWLRFDRTGQRKGELLAPSGLAVLDIDGTRLAGVLTDSFGVQTVRVHEITSGQSR